MSLLIIGGTGTLGRQIVLQALTKGYPVRCLVRNFRKASFLKEWGAELVYGDLTRPETLPPCFQGITAVIDAATSRSTEVDGLTQVDWKGKLSLLEAAQTANIQRFVFFSAQDVERWTTLPVLQVKFGLEQALQSSGIPYTIFRLTGFYQGLIEQYAIPILENVPIWLTQERTRVAYLDTQDIAKCCLRALQLPTTQNQTILLEGRQGWSSSEIISLCEQLAGQPATLRRIPKLLLDLVTQGFGFFEWGQTISDRLGLAKLLTEEAGPPRSPVNLSTVLKVDPSELIPLEDYFLEYFLRLLKRLRDINFEEIQKQKNLIL